MIIPFHSILFPYELPNGALSREGHLLFIHFILFYFKKEKKINTNYYSEATKTQQYSILLSIVALLAQEMNIVEYCSFACSRNTWLSNLSVPKQIKAAF